MERVIGATLARVHFGEVMRQVVEDDQAIVVERDGKPQVVVLSVSEYERLRAAAAPHAWQHTLADIERLAPKIWLGRPGRSLTPAEDVIRQGREERDERNADLR